MENNFNEKELRKQLTKVFENYSNYMKDFEIKKKAISNIIDFQRNYDINKLKNISTVIDALPNIYNAINLSTSSNERIESLKTEIKEKENQNIKLLDEVKKLTLEKIDINTQLDEISKNISFIQKKERFLRITSRIHPKAADMLLQENNSKLLNDFYSLNESQTVVISIDIRRSTDLMLNANNSDDFALFISGLCEGLKKIIISSFGIFDKFTGDGILAYFPIFYSGNDAILKCCITAQLCHDFFTSYYKEYSNKFKIKLKTGLGIGIDYGTTKLLPINDEPTIVGVPVVYACRLSGAPFGHTYINQPAYELIKQNDIILKEIEFEFKNQGIVIAHDLIKLGDIKIETPDWFIDAYKDL